MAIVRKKVREIEFALFSPKQIRALSAGKIFTPDTYDDDGYPIEGGLMDPHLGVIDPGIRCRTCGGRLGECMGHFGHIELTRPVVHVGYAKEIYSLLRATCKGCGRLLVTEDTLQGYDAANLNSEKFNEILEKAEKVSDSSGRCPHCGQQQQKIKFVRPYSYHEGDDTLLVTDILERFEKISEEDLMYVGFNTRPEWMIMSAIPVLPIVTRPSITLESSDRSEDDLTHKLVDILRINQRLEENINSGAPQLIIEDLWDLLQYHVATYFDNGITGIPPARHRSGRPLKTIAQRLKGKEGRFRNNLSGKRVNFSARTVISPDPNISINEVGVPEVIAVELTVPEEANKDNIDSLKGMVKNGPGKFPGAHSVIKEGKRRRILEETKDEVAETLAVGDVVERHLCDGDIVIFNRQPSLHRMSMMCHTVRVLPYSTFRLNTAVCAPYNADFDGDEMNLHVPQSEEAKAEAEILMKVQENIISPRFGEPVMGGRHDHVTGMYLLTKDGRILSRREALQLTRNIVNLPKKDTYTGRDIFSALLPNDLTMSFEGKMGPVVIEKGQVKSGVIAAKGMAGELLNEIFLKYGSDAARQYIDKSTRLAINSFMKYGFSTGIDENDLKKDGIKEITDVLDAAEKEVDKLVEQHHKKTMKVVPGKTLDESLEDYALMTLGKARMDSGKIAARRIGENSAVIMAKAGARGSLLNLTQMVGSIGQQAVRGKRIKRGYHNRTLSSFKKHDVSARANGFVRSSFKKGQTPQEYFFHAMGGRESLVDTAIRTGRSGYMQRRLINALQDLKVYPDETVRGDGKILVQFRYGEDGIDPAKTGYIKGGRKDYEKARVVPGEAVGTVAAQSIGEPGTQMTLRTFHYAGVVELSVPLGLPRLIEIIDAKRSPSNPMMTIYLDKEHMHDEKKASELAEKLDERFMEDVCESTVDANKKEIIIKTKDNAAQDALKEISEARAANTFVVSGESLPEIKRTLGKLMKKKVSGVKDIKRTFVRELNGETVIYTEGSNLKAVLKIKGVDTVRTTTNDLYQIYETLGIEAVRSAVINEASKVLKEERLDVDIRHMMLVADQMTVTGELQAVGRHGISGSKESMLARAAFEETEKHILNAAVTGEVDMLDGVAENIIIGQSVPVGTGTIDLGVKPGIIGKGK